jgi:hypothetical protein
MAFTYTENTETPGSFVIEMTHRKSETLTRVVLVFLLVAAGAAAQDCPNENSVWRAGGFT